MTSTPLSPIGKYERIRLLGMGGFGAVYEAYDRALEQRRAIKVIESPTPVDLLDKLKEARLQEICRHEYVVDVKEADIVNVDGKTVVIVVTELMEGGSTESELTLGRMSVRRACGLVAQACLGLEHLHISGVAHGDIKPANILLTSYGKAKLSDFGLAVRVSAGEAIDNVYTFHIPPEYYPGMPATHSADIYGMGVTLYRFVNGIPDFRKMAGDRSTLWKRIRSGRFPRRDAYAEHVPVPVRRIANKAMHVRADSRHSSALKLSEALNSLKWVRDWHRVGEYEWRSHLGGVEECLVARDGKSGWSIEFSRNKRRVKRLCQGSLPTASEAKHAMAQMVGETSLG